MRRLAFITDLHLNEAFPFGKTVTPKANLDIILSDLSNRGIREIIFGGDIGEASSHRYFFERMKPYAFSMILGNHDDFNKVTKHYKQIGERKELFYHFEDELFKYLFLDSSSDAISDEQLDWIRGEIKTDKELVIFIHHPILQVDTVADRMFPLKNRETLKAMFSDLQNEVLVVCGHYHMGDTQRHKNIEQKIVPSACFQLLKDTPVLEVNNSVIGYLLIEIDKAKIATKTILFKV